MSRQRERVADISQRTIGDVFQEWFVDFAIGKDPQASNYRNTFGRYYKIHINKYLEQNLAPEFLKKKFEELTFDDFNILVQTLLNAIKQILNSAKKSTQLMLIANSAVAAVTVLGGALAYYGAENGGCGNDNEGDLVEAFAESPKPAIIVSSVAALANIFLTFRQDANNHFTEIIENALVKILQKVIETGDGAETILQKLQSKLTQNKKNELEKSMEKINKNLQEQHHNQHIHESFRFRMRIITAVALALRGTVNISKISALIESSFSQESFCNGEGFTSAEFDAFSLEIPAVVTALQSIARNISNDKRKKTFEDQMGDDGILGLLSVIKESVENNENNNEFFQKTLRKVFEGDGPDIDSHAGHSHGHGHGHGCVHNCWPFSHHRNAVAPAEMNASDIPHRAVVEISPQEQNLNATTQNSGNRSSRGILCSCLGAVASCLKATPKAISNACKILYARGLYVVHAPLSAIMPESFLQGEAVENEIRALPQLFQNNDMLTQALELLPLAPNVRKNNAVQNEGAATSPSASNAANSDSASLDERGADELSIV